MKKYFKTINEKTSIEIVEKKSRFIANISPIKTEDDAINFINEIKKKYHNARHNCFAYIISEKIPILRFSDDGEPSGTAGKPILECLNSEKLENVVVVVTRYFGGILLGTGGLTRAYGRATKEAILNSKIVEMALYSVIYIKCNYTLSGKIQYEIENSSAIICDISYTDVVTFTVYVKEEEKFSFEKYLINMSNNQIDFLIDKTTLLKLVDGKVVLS